MAHFSVTGAGRVARFHRRQGVRNEEARNAPAPVGSVHNDANACVAALAACILSLRHTSLSLAVHFTAFDYTAICASVHFASRAHTPSKSIKITVCMNARTDRLHREE